MAKFGSDEQNKPWAFQSKEFIRKKLVGKTLICELDYIHTINLENLSKKDLEKNKDSKRVMKFYTVYYPDDKKQNICINVELIENGLANLTNYKIEEGNPSKEFDSMLRAEQEAKKNKVGNCGCVTPMEADEIIRKVYGIPERGAAPEAPAADNLVSLEDFF